MSEDLDKRKKVNRRGFLGIVGSVAAGSLAGCSLQSSGTSTDTGDDGTPPADETPSKVPTKTEATETSTPAETEEPTATETEAPGREYVLNFVPGENAERTDSVIFGSEYTGSESPEMEINLGEMEQLRRNDFDAVVEENFWKRDWELWLEAADNPKKLEDLKSDSGYRLDEISRNSVRKAIYDGNVEPYWGWMAALGADNAKDQLTERNENISDIIRKSILIENALKEATELSEFRIVSLPIHQEGKGKTWASQMVDGEFGEISLGIFRGFKDYRSTQKLFLTRKDGDVSDFNPTSIDINYPFVEDAVFFPYFGKADYNMEEIESVAWRNYNEEPFTVDRIAERSPASDYWIPLRFGGVDPDTQFYPDGYFEKGTPDDPNPNDDTTPTPYENTPEDPGEKENPPWAFPTYEEFDLEYEEAARMTGTMLRRMVTSNLPEDDDISVTVEETENVAFTREYGFSIAEEIRTLSSPEDYKVILDNAKALHQLVEYAEEEDEEYVIQGTLRDPVYTDVGDTQINGENAVQAIWNDESGEHNQLIENHLEPNANNNSTTTAGA